MKRIIAICCMLIMLASVLVSCGKGISVKETKEQTKLFIEALIDQDIAEAAGFFHPDTGITTEDDLNDFLQQLQDAGIVLSGEITEFKVYGFSTSYYSSEYKGSGCQIEATVAIGDSKYTVKSLLVRNDNGYGLYNFNIEKKV